MIEKSKGQTKTEQFLATLCENTFLGIWSYANPFKDDTKEFCDSIAVFENHLFIFFDRERQILPSPADRVETLWNRWKRHVIDDQIRTCHGAERYIRSGRKLYLDADRRVPSPIPFDASSVNIHKIIVAHGAKEACEDPLLANINGSLAITYRDFPDSEASPCPPFHVDIDRNRLVHVFDSHNLPIVLAELDTFFDFVSYINAKEEAIHKYSILSYCGEEDLIAHYFCNYDEEANSHYIGTTIPDISAVLIEEGEWNAFTQTIAYQKKKAADLVSYQWDRLIQKTCDNALQGVLGGGSNLFSGKSAILEMAKEPRFIRRDLSSAMSRAMENFPETDTSYARNLSLMPSFFPKKVYVFLQVRVDPQKMTYEKYRERRQYLLELACAAAKNHLGDVETVVGIAVEPPKFFATISEDFLLLDCSEWGEDLAKHYRDENTRTGMRFLETENLKVFHQASQEFPDERLGKANI